MHPAAAGAGQQLAAGRMFGHCRVGDQQIDAQTAAVLHERMTTVAELGRLAIALAHKLCIGVSGAPVGGAGALLTFEIQHSVAIARLGRLLVVLALEALE